MFDLNEMFNWDSAKDTAALNLTKEKKVYEKDARFYELAKNEKKEGVAIIRLLPDSEGKKFTAIQKIATTVMNGSQKRFVNEMSPATIGLPCPFQEKWAELYNAGKTEEAKTFSRNIRYVVNIKVIKDPARPENEGKIFLYEISGRMKDKFQLALEPSEQDIALGTKPKQLFNPLQGNSIKLVAKMGSNNQITYDATEVISEETAIYGSAEEAINDIKTNTYTISKEILSADKFKSYDDLKKDLAWVTFAEASSTASTSVAEKASVAEVASVATIVTDTPTVSSPAASAASNELDDLLSGLL